MAIKGSSGADGDGTGLALVADSGRVWEGIVAPVPEAHALRKKADKTSGRETDKVDEEEFVDTHLSAYANSGGSGGEGAGSAGSDGGCGSSGGNALSSVAPMVGKYFLRR